MQEVTFNDTVKYNGEYRSLIDQISTLESGNHKSNQYRDLLLKNGNLIFSDNTSSNINRTVVENLEEDEEEASCSFPSNTQLPTNNQAMKIT